MRRILRLFIICILITPVTGAFCQKEGPAISDTLDNVLLENQWSLGLHLNSNGWGFKFRKGRNLAALHQFMWELEFSTYKAAKEVRTINPYYSNSKSYIYGKLNYVYFLRGGMGFQNILNRKPYWGGIQLSVIYYAGALLGITKPYYLLVLNKDNQIIENRFDPDSTGADNIIGRGSFLTGVLNIGLHPGAYAKGGLEFEFGTRNRTIKALELGAILDYSPLPIAIMAFNSKQSLFLTVYLSFSMGKRYNKE